LHRLAQPIIDTWHSSKKKAIIEFLVATVGVHRSGFCKVLLKEDIHNSVNEEQLRIADILAASFGIVDVEGLGSI
jgi:hypothetical protein